MVDVPRASNNYGANSHSLRSVTQALPDAHQSINELIDACQVIQKNSSDQEKGTSKSPDRLQDDSKSQDEKITDSKDEAESKCNAKSADDSKDELECKSRSVKKEDKPQENNASSGSKSKSKSKSTVVYDQTDPAYCPDALVKEWEEFLQHLENIDEAHLPPDLLLKKKQFQASLQKAKFADKDKPNMFPDCDFDQMKEPSSDLLSAYEEELADQSHVDPPPIDCDFMFVATPEEQDLVDCEVEEKKNNLRKFCRQNDKF